MHLVPSLKQIALIKTVISFWNQNEVRDLLLKLNLHQGNSSHIKKLWREIEEKVIEIVTQIPQLGHLKENIFSLLKPIGLEILKWMKFHCAGKYVHVDLPKELCWTLQGTIDRKKTAEMLIKDDNLDNVMRYKLAYVYCLEDNIHDLATEIPNDCRMLFPTSSGETSQQSREDPLNAFYNADEESYKRIYDCQSAFKTHALVGNKVATEYFFKKLTSKEIKKSLVKTARCVIDGDVRIFLLEKMTLKQQERIFSEKPYEMLETFLDWPYQSSFMKYSNKMLKFLSKWDYSLFLNRIMDKTNDGFTDWNYEKLFQEFWQQSPDDFKRYVINELDTNMTFLSGLFKTKSKANITVILKAIATLTKEKDSAIAIFDYLICDSEWDIINFFIRKCLPTLNERIDFKEKVEKYVFIGKKKDKWDELFHMSEDSDCKSNKREDDECEINASKTF